MTASFQHDIVDGGPAARSTQRFQELIERVWSQRLQLTVNP